MTYADFVRSLYDEPWNWNPEMLPKMRRSPRLYWLLNKAVVAAAARGVVKPTREDIAREMKERAK